MMATMTTRKARATLLVSALMLAFAMVATAQTPVDPEPPWPEVSPLNWTNPDNPAMTLTLTASLVAVSGNDHIWKAQATDTQTGALVARVDVTITYGPVDTLYRVTYQRFANRWGLPPLPLQSNADSFPTLYNDDGTIAYSTVGELTWYAVFVGANPLTPATMMTAMQGRTAVTSERTADGPDKEPVPIEVDAEWTPNGCNKPCSNHWKACCDAHDACYCKGGNAAARKKCDDDFKQCLRNAGMGKFKAWIYHKAVRLFGGSHFNCTDPRGC